MVDRNSSSGNVPPFFQPFHLAMIPEGRTGQQKISPASPLRGPEGRWDSAREAENALKRDHSREFDPKGNVRKCQYHDQKVINNC